MYPLGELHVKLYIAIGIRNLIVGRKKKKRERKGKGREKNTSTFMISVNESTVCRVEFIPI